MNYIVLSLAWVLALAFSPMEASGEVFSVTANNKDPVRIGKFEKGDGLELRYISGSWTRRADMEKVSPDETKTWQKQIVLLFKEPSGDVIKIAYPTKTKNNPFRFVVQRSGNYYIQMGEPWDSGLGEVKYQITKYNN